MMLFCSKCLESKSNSKMGEDVDKTHQLMDFGHVLWTCSFSDQLNDGFKVLASMDFHGSLLPAPTPKLRHAKA